MRYRPILLVIAVVAMGIYATASHGDDADNGANYIYVNTTQWNDHGRDNSTLPLHNFTTYHTKYQIAHTTDSDDYHRASLHDDTGEVCLLDVIDDGVYAFNVTGRCSVDMFYTGPVSLATWVTTNGTRTATSIEFDISPNSTHAVMVTNQTSLGDADHHLVIENNTLTTQLIMESQDDGQPTPTTISIFQFTITGGSSNVGSTTTTPPPTNTHAWEMTADELVDWLGTRTGSVSYRLQMDCQDDTTIQSIAIKIRRGLTTSLGWSPAGSSPGGYTNLDMSYHQGTMLSLASMTTNTGTNYLHDPADTIDAYRQLGDNRHKDKISSKVVISVKYAASSTCSIYLQ